MEIGHDICIIAIDDGTIANINITIGIHFTVVVERSVNWSSIFGYSCHWSVRGIGFPSVSNGAKNDLTLGIILFINIYRTRCSSCWVNLTRWRRMVMKVSCCSRMPKASVWHLNTILRISSFAVSSRNDRINIFSRNSVVVKHTRGSYTPCCGQLRSSIIVFNITWNSAILGSKDIAYQFVKFFLRWRIWCNVLCTAPSGSTSSVSTWTSTISTIWRTPEPNLRRSWTDCESGVCIFIDWCHPSYLVVNILIGWSLTRRDHAVAWHSVRLNSNVHRAWFFSAINAQLSIESAFLSVESVPSRASSWFRTSTNIRACFGHLCNVSERCWSIIWRASVVETSCKSLTPS